MPVAIALGAFAMILAGYGLVMLRRRATLRAVDVLLRLAGRR